MEIKINKFYNNAFVVKIINGEGEILMEKQIIEKIAEISETDVVKKDTLLKDLEIWDSLAMISFIVYTKSEFNVKFDNVDVLRDAVTVGDLCNLVVERMS